MIFILDAGAILNNDSFCFERANKYYMTSSVLSELRDIRSRVLAQSGIETGSLVITDPCPLSIQTTMGKANESRTELSESDISTVALAGEFMSGKEKFVVITDDYSVQNVLKKMGVNFMGVMHRKIKKHISFKKRK